KPTLPQRKDVARRPVEHQGRRGGVQQQQKQPRQAVELQPFALSHSPRKNKGRNEIYACHHKREEVYSSKQSIRTGKILYKQKPYAGKIPVMPQELVRRYEERHLY